MENKELMVTEELNEEIGTIDYEETDCTDGGFGKIAAGLVIVGLAAAGGLAYKFRGKLEERKINRLRKKGYVSFKEDECEVREMEVEDEEVVETTEE